MKVIKDQFGFDCKCCVCTGVVPDQEDIIKELLELHSVDNLTIILQTFDQIVDLNFRLYIGSLHDKLWVLEMMFKIACLEQDEDRLEKAKKQLKKIAEETKLKYVMQVYEEWMTHCEKK